MAAWEAGGLTFFAGNNLFKHAPAIGRALADACAGGSLGDLRPEARLGEPQPAA
jgi:sarcosine oxidase